MTFVKFHAPQKFVHRFHFLMLAILKDLSVLLSVSNLSCANLLRIYTSALKLSAVASLRMFEKYT